jgi:hypothetical protein
MYEISPAFRGQPEYDTEVITNQTLSLFSETPLIRALCGLHWLLVLFDLNYFYNFVLNIVILI